MIKRTWVMARVAFRGVLITSLLSLLASAQAVPYYSQAIGSKGAISNQNVAICTANANMSSQPCSPLATLFTANISAISRSAGLVTVTTSSAHGLGIGAAIVIAGVADSTYNGPANVASVLSTTQFTYLNPGSNSSSSGGTVGGQNPVTTDALGNYNFYASPGAYDVQIYGPQIATPFVLRNVPVGGGGGSVAPPTDTIGKILTAQGTGVPSIYITKPLVDARDGFGCHQDGATDDTACVNSIITAVGSNNLTVLFTGKVALASNVTFPSNVALQFGLGAGLQPATSTITTVKGDIVATAHQQIFFNAYASQGLIDLTGNAIVTTVYPEWWGAIANSGSAGIVNQEAIQAAELGAYGTAGSGRTNASGNTIWNRELHFSGQYTVSGTINAYHMIGFSWTCADRNTCGLIENTSNTILLNGQSVAYGEFRNIAWTTTASQDASHPLVKLDYDGSQGSDLKPQFIDFYGNNFGGAQVAQTGVQIAPSGGNAQGSNIAFYNPLFLSFNQACLMIGLGSNGTGTNLATNAIAIKVIGGDFQDCVGYGMANYGGGIIDINGTTFEDGTDIWNSGARAQTGYDMLCYIAVNGEWCSAENVRSESLYTVSGFGWIINGLYNTDGQRVLTPGSSPPVGAIIQGSSAGGHGVYYQVTGSTSAASGLGTVASPLTAASGTTTSITDNTGGFTVNAWVGWEVSLISTPYQYCIITSNTSSTFTCSAGWVVDWINTATITPGLGTQYIIEPNWGTQTTSGGVTWAAMTKYILGCAGCGTNNLSIVNNLFVPGLQVYGPQSNWLGFTSTRSDAFIFQGNGYLTYSGATPGVQVSAGLSGNGAGGGGGTIDFGHVRKPLFYQTGSLGIPGAGGAVGATNGLSYLHGVQSQNCWYGSPSGASGSLGVDLCEGATVGGANTGAWYVDNASGSTTPKRLLFDATGTLRVPTGVVAPVPSINTQTASYHLALTDASGYVRMNVASANNLTVDPDSTTNFPTGTVITIRQINTGQTTIVAGAGVTISTPSTLLIRAQNSTVQLIKVSSNTWDLTGDVQ